MFKQKIVVLKLNILIILRDNHQKVILVLRKKNLYGSTQEEKIEK